MNAAVNSSDDTPNEAQTAAAKLRKAPMDAQCADEELEKALRRRLRLRPLWNPERCPQD